MCPKWILTLYTIWCYISLFISQTGNSKRSIWLLMLKVVQLLFYLIFSSLCICCKQVLRCFHIFDDEKRPSSYHIWDQIWLYVSSAFKPIAFLPQDCCYPSISPDFTQYTYTFTRHVESFTPETQTQSDPSLHCSRHALFSMIAAPTKCQSF